MSDYATIESPVTPPIVYRTAPRRLTSRDNDPFPLGIAVNNILISNLQIRDSAIENDARGDRRHLLERILKTLSDAAILPASKVLHLAFRYVLDEETPEPMLEDGQWEKAMCGILYSWKMVQCGSGVLLASVLAVLQIQQIFDSVSTRTFTMAALMLVCASIISSTLYIAFAVGKHRALVMVDWKAAAKPNAEFWKLVGLPLAFLMWSFAFFMVTLSVLVWTTLATDPDQGGIKSTTYYVKFAVSGLFLTSIPIVAGSKIYYAMEKIRDT